MSKKYDVKILTEHEFGMWNEFLATSLDGSIYYMPEYLDVLCSVTGGKFFIVSVLRNDEIVGGVALYEESGPFGKFISPRLLLYYNGIVLKQYDTTYPSKITGRHIEIMTILENTLSNYKYARLMLKSRPPLQDVRIFKQNGWLIEPGYTYVVSLTDLEHLWNRTEQNLRRLVKRCADQGMNFTEDDDFESFFNMHADTHRRKSTPIYLSFDKFKTYFTRLRSQNLCKLYHARLSDGRSVSTQLVLLGSHPTSHTVSAAVDIEYAKLGGTAFLRWKVFEDLANLGFAGNDLTDAPLNPVSHFKSQLGANLELYLVVSKPDSFKFKYGKKSVHAIYNAMDKMRSIGKSKNDEEKEN